MAYYVKGDPRWITARRSDWCKCGGMILPGQSAFYWPKGKKIECRACGTTSERRFLAEVQDEVMSGGWN